MLAKFLYIHQLAIKPADRGYSIFGQETFKLIGIFAYGMSGSPIVGRDGQVIGMLTQAFDICVLESDETRSRPPIGAGVRAEYILRNLTYYREKIRPKK